MVRQRGSAAPCGDPRAAGPHPCALDRALSIPEREIEILKSVDLFQGLHAHGVEWIAGRVREVTEPAGTVIFREGDTGDQF